MSIIKEGLLRYYSQSWHDVRLQLYSSGKLAMLHLSPVDVVTQSFDLGPLCIATIPTDDDYMLWGRSDQVFVVKQDRNSNNNLFFGVSQSQERRRWLEMINFITLRKALEAKHVHPLTTVLGPRTYLREIITSSVLASTGRRMVCNICKTMSLELAYLCEFCGDYLLCPGCHKHFNELQSPFIETPHHPYPLVDPAKAGVRFQIHDKPIKYKCGICSQECSEETYRCMECDNYAECRDCAATRVKHVAPDSKSDMCLEPKFLAPVLTVKGNNFTLNKERLHKCPRSASLISNRPWDLSTIDEATPSNAYFEVTFHKFNFREGKVSVGIGNQIFVQNQLLGYQQNSFGYYSDGFVSQNANQNVRQFVAFTERDTVGVGVLLDSYQLRKVFFTINGRFVGAYSERIHAGMDCFPGVSFTKGSEVSFSVNMTGPFKFDLRNIPNYRHAKKAHFSTLPREIALQCLVLASESFRQTCELRLVNKQFAKLALENDIWKDLYLLDFQNQNRNLKVKSWYTMYKRRLTALHGEKGKWVARKHGIENCAMEFECPLMWENLTTTGDNNRTRACDKCHKTVYKVDNLKSLEEHIQMGRCVCLQYPTYTGGLMGAYAAPRIPQIIPPPYQHEELSCVLNLDLPPFDDDEDF